MDKDKPTSNSNIVNNDTSTEEEIIEDISIAEEFSDSGDEIPLFLNEEPSTKIGKTFNPVDPDDDEDDNLLLQNIDELLSSDNIAKHFKPEKDIDDGKENKNPSANFSLNPLKNSKSSTPVDDVILINDRKVSLSDLKKVQKVSFVPEHESKTNQQFSSLQLPKVPPSVSLRTSHSLDFDLSLGSTDDSSDNGEQENDIEEIVESSRFPAEIPSVSEESDEKVVVKKMERISLELLKEPLDDITEEESEVESKELKIAPVNPTFMKDALIEKGSYIRKCLELNVDFDASPPPSRCHSLDYSTKNVKELQEYLAENNSYLDALNLKLGSLVRREIFKNGIPKEPSKMESAAYSIATSASTEYRTLNDDLNIKIIDIENELQERAYCIEKLKEKLDQTLLDREQIQTENENLAKEILELKTKVAEIGSPSSEKSSDEDKLTILSSKLSDFNASLNNEELVCFEKVRKKFMSYHENELKKLTAQTELEMEKYQDLQAKLQEQIENEKNKITEIVEKNQTEMENQRFELLEKHKNEMEELRQYFEKRCVDMEKQYSEEVFSQHSKKLDDDSDESDNETLPDDDQQMHEIEKTSNKFSNEHQALSTDGEEMKRLLEEKISEVKSQYDKVVQELSEKLQKYEGNFNANDEYSSQTIKPSELNNLIPEDELTKIIQDYERRLEEQVALAREDVLHEIEMNIKALLSENSQDDSHWPTELILLREKLTAKSQLEIAQMKIKHEEEMAKVKADYELQIQRKLKRNAAFDAHRDLDRIITERDNLRELSASLRFALCELAKYFTHCEEDLNSTINEELLNKSECDFNISVLSSSTKRLITFKPDISSLIAVVEDPKLLDFIKKHNDDENSLVQINIVDCLERLNTEANNIIELSQQICKRSRLETITDGHSDKTDCSEEEDGLKRGHCKSLEIFDKSRNNSEDDLRSLPLHTENIDPVEVEKQFKELQKLLTSSEDEKRDLKENLRKAEEKSNSLEKELQEAKDQLGSLHLVGKETLTEGFGTQTPTHSPNKSFSLNELQEKAKSFLSTTSNLPKTNNSDFICQMIEDFCRETERYMEIERKERDDLHLQIESADKQVKATRKFLEDQATEREQERDEFSREIERLREILKEKQKQTSQDNKENEIANLEQQIKELTENAKSVEEQKSKLENDLRTSVEKIYDLREMIADLEAQVAAKTLSEKFLNEKCQEFENYIDHQNVANESLKDELDKVKSDIDDMGYEDKIQYLEEQLRISRPTAEQKTLIEQIASQMKTVEVILDRKTKTLESFHTLATACSTTCSSPSEDVSRGLDFDGVEQSPVRINRLMNVEGCGLPLESVQKVLDKLSKHNRIEEATVKKITDLEMQANVMRGNLLEIQQEKEILQERMSEQLMKISSLQTRLDEQRIRAEELNKQSTSDLTLRVHDLHTELSNLKETLLARDKQVANLNQLLDHSKKIIDRQEQELVMSEDNDKSLVDRMEDELKAKTAEIQRLKDKIKTETINKVALPDLMETMMAEKNEEIEILRRQLYKYEKSFEQNSSSPPTTNISGTILNSIPEYDEPEQLRRAADNTQYSHIVPKVDTFTISEFSTNKATIDTFSQTSNIDMPKNVHLIPRHIVFTSGDESSISHEMHHLQTDLDMVTSERNLNVENLKRELDEKMEQISNLELSLQAKTKLYEDLVNEKQIVEQELDDYRLNLMRFSAYEVNMKKKDEELNNSLIKIKQLEQTLKNQNLDLENLRLVMSEKDNNIQKLSEDVEVHRNKCKENERVLTELEKLKRQVTSYNDVMEQKENLLKKLEEDLTKYVKMENELLEKANNCDKLLDDNNQLKSDVDHLKRELSLKTFALEKCKFDLQDMEQKFDSLNKVDPAGPTDTSNLSVVEIAAKLERELNYAEELDDNLIKAIESESDINSELDEMGNKGRSKYHEKMKKLEDEVENLKVQNKKICSEFEDEKKNFDAIQMQDASLIEAIRIRLETALDNENVLKKLLETEKHKAESLSSQLTGVQRTKSFDNYLLFSKNQFNESPRRLAKFNEFESEVIMRLESEIKLLTAQNERERDRVIDLQKVLDNERDRFSKALADQQEYSDQMKKEIKKLLNNKEKLEMELDQLHAIKLKYFEIEAEKEKLLDTIKSLRSERSEINQGARPKYRHGNEDSEKFMDKLKEINKTLSDNVKENHQMAETLHLLTEERRILQQRIGELESNNNLIYHHSQNNLDLEERANHLFAKYMRCESFRKALIYQKKFLLITFASTVGLTNDSSLLFKSDPKKKKSFRSAVLVVIAIERMKYIARRWSGKRMNAKAIFSAAPPRRSQSASNNNWTRFDTNMIMRNAPISNDKFMHSDRAGFQLPSPSHFIKAPLQRLFDN